MQTAKLSMLFFCIYMNIFSISPHKGYIIHGPCTVYEDRDRLGPVAIWARLHYNQGPFTM